jgi:ankyrin repeat protein
MSWARQFSRDELLEHSAEFREDPAFIDVRDSYLARAVENLEIELAEALLKAGANPDGADLVGESLLDGLFFEYLNARSTHGEAVLRLTRLLLTYGANPDRIGSCNWRPIDRCIEYGLHEVVELFIEFGADPSQREFI